MDAFAGDEPHRPCQYTRALFAKEKVDSMPLPPLDARLVAESQILSGAQELASLT